MHTKANSAPLFSCPYLCTLVKPVIQLGKYLKRVHVSILPNFEATYTRGNKGKDYFFQKEEKVCREATTLTLSGSFIIINHPSIYCQHAITTRVRMSKSCQENREFILLTSPAKKEESHRRNEIHKRKKNLVKGKLRGRIVTSLPTVTDSFPSFLWPLVQSPQIYMYALSFNKLATKIKSNRFRFGYTEIMTRSIIFFVGKNRQTES